MLNFNKSKITALTEFGPNLTAHSGRNNDYLQRNNPPRAVSIFSVDIFMYNTPFLDREISRETHYFILINSTIVVNSINFDKRRNRKGIELA